MKNEVKQFDIVQWRKHCAAVSEARLAARNAKFAKKTKLGQKLMLWNERIDAKAQAFIELHPFVYLGGCCAFLLAVTWNSIPLTFWILCLVALKYVIVFSIAAYALHVAMGFLGKLSKALDKYIEGR